MPKKRSTTKTKTKRRNKRAGTPSKRPNSPRAKYPPNKSRKTSDMQSGRDRHLTRDREIHHVVPPFQPLIPPTTSSNQLRTTLGMSHKPNPRKLRDASMPSNTRTRKPQTQSTYNQGLLMPAAGAEDSGPMKQRLDELIANIQENQIRMQDLKIGTEDWEKYKLDNSPITYQSAKAFYKNQEYKIRNFYQEKQEQKQIDLQTQKNMLKKTGKRTSLMTLGLLATLMANDLYTDKPTGIPPYQRLIADTPADIVNKATGNDGLIQGVEEMDPDNPNYYRIYSKGKRINFDPSTTTMKQWHEAKKKAFEEHKPFDIFNTQEAVKFFLEKGNKDLYGIALKKISRNQQQLLERARLAQVIKEEENQRRHKIRGDNTKNKRNNKGNNNNKHNNQFTRRGGKK